MAGGKRQRHGGGGGGGSNEQPSGGLNRAARRRLAAEAATISALPKHQDAASDEEEDEEDVSTPAPAEAYGALLSFLRASDSHEPENRVAEDDGYEHQRTGRRRQDSIRYGKHKPLERGSVKRTSATAIKPDGGLSDDRRRRGSAASADETIGEAAAAPTAEDESDDGMDQLPTEAPDWYRQHFGRALDEVKGASAESGSKWVDFGEDLGQFAAGRWGRHTNGAGKWQSAARGGSVVPAPPAPPRLAGYHVRERLAGRWRELHGAELAPEAQAKGGAGAKSRGKTANAGGEDLQAAGLSACLPLRPGSDFVDSAQRSFFALLAAYKDIYLAGRPYPPSPETADPLMDAILLHCLNHCGRAADAIKKNNDALKAQKAQAVKDGVTGCHIPPEAVPADQGFTRAKVLLLLPQRNMAFRVVSKLLKLAIRETRTDSVQGKQRFVDDFYTEDSDDEDGGRRKVEKPPEYKTLFGGNTDDHFMLGIKLTRGSVVLTADFLQADIIAASPLGVVTRLEEDSKARQDGHPLAKDFLSSVEILVMDRADVMLMQNWSHLSTVAAGLNQVPSEQHGADIMRVREWALSGDARLYRQTVLLSSMTTPEINAFVHRHFTSHAGAVRWKPDPRGVLASVVVQVQQLYERLVPKPIAQAADARLEHFKRKVWPGLKDGRRQGQLIFVASYFDYVRPSQLHAPGGLQAGLRLPV
eukprot:jgi/Tetstr1/423903/TSEL_014526.t1